MISQNFCQFIAIIFTSENSYVGHQEGHPTHKHLQSFPWRPQPGEPANSGIPRKWSLKQLCVRCIDTKLNKVTCISIHKPVRKFWDRMCCHRLQSRAHRGPAETFLSGFGATRVPHFAVVHRAAASSEGLMAEACNPVESVSTDEWTTSHSAAVTLPPTPFYSKWSQERLLTINCWEFLSKQ